MTKGGPMPINSEQARSSHSSCCICWPIVRFSPREFPNDPTLNVEKIYLSTYCKTDSSNQDFHFSPSPYHSARFAQTETRTGARESWGPLASGGIALDRQFSLIFSTKRPSGVIKHSNGKSSKNGSF